MQTNYQQNQTETFYVKRRWSYYLKKNNANKDKEILINYFQLKEIKEMTVK